MSGDGVHGAPGISGSLRLPRPQTRAPSRCWSLTVGDEHAPTYLACRGRRVAAVIDADDLDQILEHVGRGADIRAGDASLTRSNPSTPSSGSLARPRSLRDRPGTIDIRGVGPGTGADILATTRPSCERRSSSFSLPAVGGCLMGAGTTHQRKALTGRRPRAGWGLFDGEPQRCAVDLDVTAGSWMPAAAAPGSCACRIGRHRSGAPWEQPAAQ